MLRIAALALLVLAVAIGVGAGSAWYALDAEEGIGALTVGNWTAYPDIGSPDADPYAKARIARDGVLALGRAEGLSFIARRDSAGDGLDRACRYTIEGPFPPARFFTLYAADRTLTPLPRRGLRAAALHSYALLRNSDNSITIATGTQAAPGNWLALPGSGPFALVLTLYDTPIATSTGIDEVALPQIIRGACDG
jgi:hypothetical protein